MSAGNWATGCAVLGWWSVQVHHAALFPTTARKHAEGDTAATGGLEIPLGSVSQDPLDYSPVSYSSFQYLSVRKTADKHTRTWLPLSRSVPLSPASA